MIKLSIEEKAKLYDEAIERAKSKIKNNKDHVLYEDDVIDIFPELKESEDERIRKALINFLHEGNPFKNIKKETRQKWIAWLEKQGDANKEYWRGYREGKQEILDKYSELEKQGEKPQGKSALDAAKEENVDNQNCVKPADNVEPKFHKGEWIIHQGTENIYQVVAIIDNQYQLKYGDNYTIQYCEDVDRCARLWTIQDAKDGDVLASNRSIFIFSQEYIAGKPEAHCGIMNGLFLVKPEGCWTNEKYYPATKEQRDTLEKVMTDAGYTFDFEKKELKKIDNVILTTWSEEDENRFNNLCWLIDQSSENEPTKNGFKNWLKSFKDIISPKQEWNEEDEKMLNQIIKDYERGNEIWLKSQGSLPFGNRITWLKSLRPQKQWKPSDEQMKAVRLAAEIGTANNSWAMGILKDMHQELKKLMEE